jgi:hypothetical protein
MTKKIREQEYAFKRHSSIGAADAEDDDKFLKACFIDTGDLQSLRDCNDPKRIVIGRTGVGKSALLRQLREAEEHVIELPPETLSLSYIANSDVLKFFETAGVKLDIFYQLLWRHVFAVELIKVKFRITDEKTKRSFLERFGDVFSKNKGKEKGVEYLQQWGEKFWQETEYRIKEFTTKLEDELKEGLSVDLGQISINASEVDKLTKEQKHEVIYKGQRVVNDVQIKDLGEVIRLLAEDIFIDPKERYYITIDRLDENWAEEIIRYKLIRALIETIRHFQKIRSVKIVIALRKDLLETVFEITRDSGFQEEKYESLYLPIHWNSEQLENLLDQRVSALIREQYTKQVVHLSNILPKRLGSKPAIEYILDRTFMRPRDAILFLNKSLEKAQGKATISVRDVRAAEGEYSVKRLRSLNDEWGRIYPGLLCYVKILERRTFSFKYGNITKEQIETFVVEICDARDCDYDPIYREAQSYIDGKRTESSFLNYLFRTLYKLGVVGIKTDAHTPTRWSYLNEPTLPEGEVKPTSSIYIQPTFWRALDIQGGVLREDLEDVG